MHPRIKEVHDYLLSAHVHLQDAVDTIPPDRRDVAPQEGRWSVAQVLEHLAIVETRIARLLAKRLAEARAGGVGQETEATTILWTVDVMRVLDRRERIEAPEQIRPTQTRTSVDAAEALKRAQSTLQQTVLDADGIALGEISHPHPVLGPLNLYQWGIFAAAHEMRHALQIREIGEAR
jgi:uncharacterized damage-inducible protein DinB